jgi:predicted  nucleic acid-binding Zn-ribbon protein
MHKCPNCGEPTEGSFSEGGINFAICGKCYEKEYRKQIKNASIHKSRGVDGWQEIYSDAPSKEDIDEEMAEMDDKLD